MWLGLMLGCAQPLGIEAWQQVVRECELDARRIDVWADGPPVELTPACEGRLIADFGMDLPPERRDLAVAGAWALAAGELGTVGEVRESALISAEFLRQLQRNGHASDPVAGVLYGLATHRIDTVVDGDATGDGQAWFDPVRATMGLRESGLANARATPWMADVFVHEMWHAEGWSHVRCPGTDVHACDRSLNGAYGAATGFLSLAATRTDSPFAADSLEVRAWEFHARVLE